MYRDLFIFKFTIEKAKTIKYEAMNSVEYPSRLCKLGKKLPRMNKI